MTRLENMRRLAFLTLAAFAVSAAPALSQDMQGMFRNNEIWAQQQMMQQHSVATENQLNALGAQLATDQRMQQLRAQSLRPAITTPDPATAKLLADPNLAMPSIPDAELAASRARVLAVTQKRR